MSDMPARWECRRCVADATGLNLELWRVSTARQELEKSLWLLILLLAVVERDELGCLKSLGLGVIEVMVLEGWTIVSLLDQEIVYGRHL